ncbi:MAG: hypothetical protein BWY82_02064 [Verrucomicrobia bacterium ADurb.Bin474]|nr:MAG: hypothetical protein BWY82_02064 [Verrucomicrobia bacterium ADurb.Bin474]
MTNPFSDDLKRLHTLWNEAGLDAVQARALLKILDGDRKFVKSESFAEVRKECERILQMAQGSHTMLELQTQLEAPQHLTSMVVRVLDLVRDSDLSQKFLGLKYWPGVSESFCVEGIGPVQSGDVYHATLRFEDPRFLGEELRLTLSACVETHGVYAKTGLSDRSTLVDSPTQALDLLRHTRKFSGFGG